MAQKPLDLDASLGFDDEPVHTKQIKMFGQTFTMVCDLNAFALSELTTGEPAAIVRFFDSVIHEDDRQAFRTAMSNVKNLDAEKLGKILSVLVEAAAERPTTQPSASSRGAQKRTSQPKSVGGSSSTRAVR